MVAALTIMFLVALAVYPEAAKARTTAELQADVNLLNQLMEDLSYSDWTAQYDTLRRSTTYEDMDWSQDECSVPDIAGRSRKDLFLSGCLRHDMTWRSLAVIDAGESTGSGPGWLLSCRGTTRPLF